MPVRPGCDGPCRTTENGHSARFNSGESLRWPSRLWRAMSLDPQAGRLPGVVAARTRRARCSRDRPCAGADPASWRIVLGEQPAPARAGGRARAQPSAREHQLPAGSRLLAQRAKALDMLTSGRRTEGAGSAVGCLRGAADRLLVSWAITMSISDADLTAAVDGRSTDLLATAAADGDRLAPATRSTNTSTAVGVGDAWPRGRPRR